MQKVFQYFFSQIFENASEFNNLRLHAEYGTQKVWDVLLPHLNSKMQSKFSLNFPTHMNSTINFEMKLDA